MDGDTADRGRRPLAAARTELLARIADLTRDVDGVMAASRNSNADDEHDPEGATIAWEREQAIALLARARGRLAEVDAALARLDAGTYGTCVTCGRPIGDERLVARPAVATCVACAGPRRR